jgi:hypothetical protein
MLRCRIYVLARLNIRQEFAEIRVQSARGGFDHGP